MTFLVLKQSLILGILLFEATSGAAVRGQWKAEHERLHTTTHHENERLPRGGEQRKLDFFLSEGPRQREWNQFRSFPEVYHHSHHHHGSSNQQKMKNSNERTDRKMNMNMNIQMGGKMMKTSAPITKAPTEGAPATDPPTKSIPATKLPTKAKTPTEPPTKAKPVTNSPLSISPVGSDEQPNQEQPNQDSPSTPKPVKFPTNKPITSENPMESPTEQPVESVSPPTFMGVPSGEPSTGNDDDDEFGNDDDDLLDTDDDSFPNW
jgi:hypothetical protein